METYTMGYKYRIYPNKTQKGLINRTLGSCRFVFKQAGQRVQVAGAEISLF